MGSHCEMIERNQGNALLQVLTRSTQTRAHLPHDELFNECDPSRPEPPSVEVLGSDRFQFATKSKVIVDIGGNAGEDVEMMLKQNPTARIYTFEPIPQYFKELKARFASNPNVSVQNFGMSDTNAQKEFILDGVGTTGADQNTRGEHVQVHLRDVDEVFLEIQKETGQVPDMLNMNCEGCEYAVMQRMLHRGWLERLAFIQLSWHLAGDVKDRVGQRCSAEKRLWQSHGRTFKSEYGWIGWQLAQ